MEIEIYNAFVNAGVPADEAKAAVESLNKEIDKRYSLHASQLATKGDLHEKIGEVKSEISEAEARLLRSMQDMQRWTITATFAAVAAMAAVSKFL